MTTLTPSEFAGFEVKKASDTKEDGYCILLYSRGGGGKTTFAAGADDDDADKPVMFIDAEGGMKAVSDRPDIDYIPVKDWREVKRLKEAFIKEPDLPWKTIVLDNLSEIIQMSVIDIVGNAEDQVSQPKYGEMAREVLSLVRTLRDLSRYRGINVIIIAWDSIERDQAGKLKSTIEATPKLQKSLPGIVDIIGYISPIDGDPDHRKISFEPHSQTIAKFRRNRTDVASTIPLEIVYGLDNLPMSDILAALKRGKEWPEKKYTTGRSRVPTT